MNKKQIFVVCLAICVGILMCLCPPLKHIKVEETGSYSDDSFCIHTTITRLEGHHWLGWRDSPELSGEIRVDFVMLLLEFIPLLLLTVGYNTPQKLGA